MTELVGVFDADLRFVGVNAELVEALRTTPEALLGSSVVDVVVPADQARMLRIFDLSQRHGVAPGFAAYDIVRPDGSTLTVEMAGSEIVVDGQTLYSVVGRQTHVLDTTHRVMDGLMAGHDMDAVVEPLLDLFGWRETGNRVALAWVDGDQVRAVSTGLPATLSGSSIEDGSGRGNGDGSVVAEPWAGVLAGQGPVRGASEDLLDPARLAQARAFGLRGLWIEPLAVAGTGVGALVTVWGGADGYAPDIHAYAMGEVMRYLELVLRWQDQATRLAIAANGDALTGLANRRVFFDRLAAVGGGGAVLFVDVDDFKAVNDRWGHATGDALLRQTGTRLAGAAGEGALVARIGGDEFGVVLPGASIEEARGMVDRVRTAFALPFDVGEIAVPSSISVGMAHDEDELCEATLDAADRDQYQDKRSRRA